MNILYLVAFLYTRYTWLEIIIIIIGNNYSSAPVSMLIEKNNSFPNHSV